MQASKTTIKKLLFLLIITLFFFIITEITLRFFSPYPLVTMGLTRCPNGKLYGWGYPPKSKIIYQDPDNGKIYTDKLNSKAWRDTEHEFTNKENKFRILVIGDSNTFGALVPKEKIYTKILEKKINSPQKTLFNRKVEIISMGYGGWGTDQAVEALKTEGIKYKPNLVILQFCKNDIDDNAYYQVAQTSPHEWQRRHKGWKPFYYKIDKTGKLKRKKNNFYQKNETLKKFIFERIIVKSEILKRLYKIYIFQKIRAKKNSPINQEVIKTIAGIELDSPLQNQLSDLPKPIDKSQLAQTLTENKRNISQNRLEKLAFILNNPHFHTHFRPEVYRYQENKSEEEKWQIYEGLIKKAKKLALKHNFKLAIFNVTGIASYDWKKKRFLIAEEPEYEKNYLNHIERIKKICTQNDIIFIPNKRKYQRFYNDPHPNIAGHNSIALDIYENLADILIMPSN